MKKLTALFLALVMLLSLAACGNKPEETTKAPDNVPASSQDVVIPTQPSVAPDKEVKYKDRLVVANSSTLQYLDPQNNNNLYSGQIYHLTHNTVLQINYNTHELSPELCTEYTMDGLVITMKFRDDVTFHNGDKFTAKDVKYTFERANESSYKQVNVAAIGSMETPDDYTLVITLKEPDCDIIENLAALYILNKRAIDEDPEKGGMVGTGPYILDEWAPDDYTLLKRNENYWEETLPPSKEILWRKIAEASARVIALQTGEIDICLETPAAEVQHIIDSPNCDVIQMPSVKLVYLALAQNGYCEAFLDQRVRQALNYATNTEDVIFALTEGYGVPAHGIIPIKQDGFDPNTKVYSFDLQKAKDLLKEAGYDENNKLKITFLYNKAHFPGFFELLQAQWALANVELTLRSDDSAVVSDVLKAKEYDIYMTQWNFSTTASSLYKLWNSSSSSNRTLTNDPKVDEMTSSIIKELDTTKRQAMVSELQQYLSDSGQMIPLYNDTLLIGINKNLKYPDAEIALAPNQSFNFSYAGVVLDN